MGRAMDATRRPLFRTMRGRVSALTVAVSAAFLFAAVALVALATESVLRGTLESSLEKRLDGLEGRLAAGEELGSLAGTGAELVQVIDADGSVVASSSWAEGVSPISAGGLGPGERRSSEVDDVGLSRIVHEEDDADDVDGAAEAADEPAEAEPQEAPAQQASPAPPAQAPQQSQPPAQAPQAAPAPTPDDGWEGDSGYDDDGGGWDGNSGYSGGSGYGDSGYDGGDDDDDWDEASHCAHASPRRLGTAPASPDGVDLAPGDASAWAPRVVDTPAAGEGSQGEQAGGAQGDGGAAEELSASELLGSEGPFLVVERGVATPDGVVTLAAMTSLAPASTASRTVALVLAVGMAVALAAIGLGSGLVVAGTLAPVERMRSEAAGISIGDLSRRLPEPAGARELSGLARTFNDMLARLEEAVAEQRRFVSDASHELKSPVAAIRVMLEAMRDHPDAVDADALAGDLLAENDRLSGIVGNLLLLARQDEGVARVERQPLDLADLLYEEAAALGARSPLAVDVSGVAPVVCSADRDALSHAVRNVLDNAARHASGRVALSCRELDDASAPDGSVSGAEIRVSDDGQGIPEADRERVFERFVRLGESRSRSAGGTGLGLSVVRAIARQHGGDARFVEPELGGATISLTIPAPGVAAPGGAGR